MSQLIQQRLLRPSVKLDRGHDRTTERGSIAFISITAHTSGSTPTARIEALARLEMTSTVLLLGFQNVSGVYFVLREPRSTTKNEATYKRQKDLFSGARIQHSLFTLYLARDCSRANYRYRNQNLNAVNLRTEKDCSVVQIIKAVRFKIRTVSICVCG
jgi:hypothetical protein